MISGSSSSPPRPRPLPLPLSSSSASVVGFADGDWLGLSGVLVCSSTMIGACSRGSSASATSDPTTYAVIGSTRTRPSTTFNAIPLPSMILLLVGMR